MATQIKGRSEELTSLYGRLEGRSKARLRSKADRRQTHQFVRRSMPHPPLLQSPASRLVEQVLWDMAILLRNCELEGPMDDNPSNGDPMDDSPCEPPMLENSSKDLNALTVMSWLNSLRPLDLDIRSSRYHRRSSQVIVLAA